MKKIMYLLLASGLMTFASCASAERKAEKGAEEVEEAAEKVADEVDEEIDR
ncbi:hypothetical protein ACFS7Z_17525 [Pontibacter toksunensis]|uniref:Uncharacterized protein n=1 Tax=Pontibacter toksunensis TaxID=1332631 RepID=A0ABW6BWH4_9BACT